MTSSQPCIRKWSKLPTNIQVGQKVFVPLTLLGLQPSGPSPFEKLEVADRRDRSVKVRLRDESLSDWIGTSRITLRLGLLIVRIGDFDEATMLDPLAKSILQFSRILLPEDHVRLIQVRTLGELEHFWRQLHSVHEQVVLIGHGSPTSVRFGDGNISYQDVITVLRQPTPRAKEFISLCCQTGVAPIGKAFSAESFCAEFFAPMGKLHGCGASQFCQSYLFSRLIDGKTPATAFKIARGHLAGTATFRRWKNGSLQKGN